ncbi:helix-turn-helix domain-containing protein [Mesorhizobium amorphae]|uniref:Transcriptional regulator n=1 Tax=Mesorhizobium amorphae CCNWGS0123 TaxID=1082933 RepID=G6YIC7_9HYPH|nr:helix-turn-helix domain-containing protein [Mesorhizobium amorphae]EHH06308.1 transcriptional regulator [Mesorhizobium amorphae CCNWGS0123]
MTSEFGRRNAELAEITVDIVTSDRKCAVHWEALPAFKERFMRVEAAATVYEVDNDIWACAGGTAAFDMLVELVKRHCGEPVAVNVGELAVAGRVRTGDERQRLLLAQSAMPVLEIAVSCGFVSASHFSRCFGEAHQIAPHEARSLPAGGFSACQRQNRPSVTPPSGSSRTLA